MTSFVAPLPTSGAGSKTRLKTAIVPRTRMPASVASAPMNRTSAATSRPRKAASTAGKSTQGAVNGVSNGVQHHASPYTIMASRIANRVAEMAENMTFVEREKYVCPSVSGRWTITARFHSSPVRPCGRTPSQPQVEQKPVQRKPPRKLEMRLPNHGQSPTNITFSAPFLDNTLSKLLALQNRMLTVSNDIAASEDVDDHTKQEQFAQSAELSRIIALICAEKARQGA
ncbi:hypothetical protein OPT61_g9990 [Boeremia exigua]|uniref:Uncharacterized protein n=1 Tax=Boeremia exigua TaxID=749465 RepID=A0ACC2HSQ4_9PLEO|nr:hypothetical protein OPT61_g9990 [Boeremia exigua]